MTDSILIVDDSTFIVEGLMALLKKKYQPIPSYSGEECLAILMTVKPSIIILDIMMEPMDGWETLARIKENTETRHIPVLMFSAKKISPEEAETNRIIIDDFITKPVNPKKLLEAIDRVLARQDFNKNIIQTWTAAGVSPEIIDEYLDVKTNLDVDLSLLAVMKRQLDLAHQDAKNRNELLASIAVIEDRVVVSRARIDTFCREKSAVLPALVRPGMRSITESAISVPSLAQKPETPKNDPAGQSVTTGSIPLMEEPVAPLPEPEQHGIPTDGRIQNPKPAPPPLPEEHLQADEQLPAAAVAPRVDTSRIIIPPLVHEPVFLSPPVVEPAEPVSLPVNTLSARGEIRSPEINPVNIGTTESESQDLDSLFEPFEMPAEPEVSSHYDPGIVGQPSTISSVPRKATGAGTPLAVRPGGGTRTPSMLAPATTRRGPAAAQDPVTDRHPGDPLPASSGSFFSRLIATITGLFKKKKS
jgi:two-component system, OmpR family, response regulator